MDQQHIAAYLQASGSERVIHVDEQDRELGVVSRADAQSRGLITRCTFIFVFNSRGELCVHQRTPHKRLYPSFWDVAAGGVVAAGESYLQGAERELAEELGHPHEGQALVVLGEDRLPHQLGGQGCAP